MESYAVLKVLWWLFLGAYLIGLGVFIGGDAGLLSTQRWLAKSDYERSIIMDVLSRPGDSHQAWFLLVGGAVFAAWWPVFHATLMGGLWVVFLMLLLGAILGPMGSYLRTRLRIRRLDAYDALLALVGVAVMLILGTAFGNTLTGFAFSFSKHGAVHFQGGFGSLFTSAFPVLTAGLMALGLSVFQGMTRLIDRTEGVLRDRVRMLYLAAGVFVILAFTGGGVWLTQLTAVVVTGTPHLGAQLSPAATTATAVPGGFLERFLSDLPLLVMPIILYAAVLLGMLQVFRRRYQNLRLNAAAAWLGAVGSVGAATFPMLAPSRIANDQSLSLFNGAANEKVLVFMIIWLGVLLPFTLWYVWWAQRTNNHAGHSLT